MSKLLVKHVLAVTLDDAGSILQNVDILIDGALIETIGPDLDCHDAIHLDARGLIAMPGLVNAHIHLWQAVLRGLAGDYTLDDYFEVVLSRVGERLTAADLKLGNSLGALEQINAGTTSVFDWCNNAVTPEHAAAAIEGLETSGIRAVFGYGIPSGSASIDEDGSAADIGLEDLRTLRLGRFSSDERSVRLAAALRGPDFAPFEELERELMHTRELGLIASFHIGARNYAGRQRRRIAELDEHELVDPNINVVHANDLDEDEYGILAARGASCSCTPVIEMMMGHGRPAYGKVFAAGGLPALGSDVVAGCGGDMFSQMRATLTTARLFDYEAAYDTGAPLTRVRVTAQDVLRAATLGGALGLGQRTGSLAPGKLADLVLLKTTNPGMAPLIDPVSSIVLHATAEDVDTVIIDGEIRKRSGRLMDESFAAKADASASIVDRLVPIADRVRAH